MADKTFFGVFLVAVLLAAAMFVGASHKDTHQPQGPPGGSAQISITPDRDGSSYYYYYPRYSYPAYYYPYYSYYYRYYYPYYNYPYYTYPTYPSPAVSYPLDPTKQLGVEGQVCGIFYGQSYGCQYGLACDYSKSTVAGLGTCSSDRPAPTVVYPAYVGGYYVQ